MSHIGIIYAYQFRYIRDHAPTHLTNILGTPTAHYWLIAIAHTTSDTALSCATDYTKPPPLCAFNDDRPVPLGAAHQLGRPGNVALAGGRGPSRSSRSVYLGTPRLARAIDTGG
jgi:hypothetical protein